MVRNGLVRYTSLPFLVMLCLFFLFAIGGAVTSATIYSTDNSSSTAIQETISKMNNGDTLILDPGIYRENNITVSRDITIKGNASLQGSFANTIIDGMNEGRSLPWLVIALLLLTIFRLRTGVPRMVHPETKFTQRAGR